MNDQACTASNIWDLSCVMLDLLLVGSFDSRELANLISGVPEADAMTSGCCIKALPENERPIHVAHRLCHSNTPVARQIQRQLDLRYRTVMESCAALRPEELSRTHRSLHLHACPNAAAFLWALCRDRRSEVRAMAVGFTSRVQILALRDYCKDSSAT